MIDALRADGRTVIGPTIRDEVIALDEVTSVADFPVGRGVEASAGRYRLTERDDARRFDHAVGPMSWKRWTFPPRTPIRVGRRAPDGVAFEPVAPTAPPMAFVGVRACEIAALAIQDRVLLDGPAVDADYRARRAATFIVAVECATPASTCFCTSAGTGPEVSTGYDVALTELDDGFVVRVGSAAGDALIAGLALEGADDARTAAARDVVAGARVAMGAPLDLSVARDRLAAVPDHPGWAAVADRCLSCTNCTLVCPTCFCTSVTQRSDLDGTVATSERLGFVLQRRVREGRGRFVPTRTEGPLPPVAHPQVLDLVGPVRIGRLRRLRTVHRVVSGRHRRPRGTGGHRRCRADGCSAADRERRPCRWGTTRRARWRDTVGGPVRDRPCRRLDPRDRR